MSIRKNNKIIAGNYKSDIITDATQTEKGKIRIATDTEVAQGLSKDTAITPYHLANNSSKAQVEVDNETIINNNKNEITTVGVKSKSNVVLYDWIGTKEEYETGIADGTISEDWICWVTDYEGDDKCRSMPIGMIYSLNCTEDYIPDGSLPCNGSEYNSSQFKALWDNYLTGEEIDKIIAVNTFGTLTNNNGILSGFSSNNYFKLKNIPSELIISFTPTDIINKQMLFTDVSSAGRFRIENGSLYRYHYVDAGVIEKEEVCALTINKPFQLRLKNIVDNKYNTVGVYIDNRMILEETGIGIKADINFGYGVSTSYETSSNTGWSNSTVYVFSGTIDISSNTYKDYNTLLNTCTYEEYEQDLSTYGQCSKFALSLEKETFKVPFIKDGAVIQQAKSDSELGKLYNEGLPNITGCYAGEMDKEVNSRISGAFYTASASNAGWGNENETGYIGYMDASLSDATYGKTDDISLQKVQMNAVALRYFVVIANGSINKSQMDWGKWLEGLSSKLDKNNLTECAVVVRTSDRSIAPSWYRIWSDGWCEQGGRLASATSQTVELLIEMSDINYCLTFGPYATTTTDTEGWDMIPGSSDYTTTSFRVTSVSSRNDNWKVEGYMK